MNEWGGVITAVVAGLASAAVAWLGLRGEPAALRKLRAMNEALEKMSESDAKLQLAEARDAVARGIAQRTLNPNGAFLFFRWASWVLLALSFSLLAVFGILSANGGQRLEWMLTVTTVGSFLAALSQLGSVIAQLRSVKRMQELLDERQRLRDRESLIRLQTEAARGRTTENDPSHG